MFYNEAAGQSLFAGGFDLRGAHHLNSV